MKVLTLRVLGYIWNLPSGSAANSVCVQADKYCQSACPSTPKSLGSRGRNQDNFFGLKLTQSLCQRPMSVDCFKWLFKQSCATALAVKRLWIFVLSTLLVKKSKMVLAWCTWEVVGCISYMYSMSKHVKTIRLGSSSCCRRRCSSVISPNLYFWDLTYRKQQIVKSIVHQYPRWKMPCMLSHVAQQKTQPSTQPTAILQAIPYYDLRV